MFWDNSKSNELQKVEEELMTTRIREMETLTELKELRLKVMELETQVQVSTNQLRRQDEEGKKVREELDSALAREKEMANRAREQQHRYEWNLLLIYWQRHQIIYNSIDFMPVFFFYFCIFAQIF